MKKYTESKGVYLLLGMGGPQTPFEQLIRSDRGQTWGNTLMYDSLNKAYDGIFIDFYFNPDNFCESTIKTDSCLCQIPTVKPQYTTTANFLGSTPDSHLIPEPACKKNCGECSDTKKCRSGRSDSWTTFFEQVLITASGIISSDDMIGYS